MFGLVAEYQKLVTQDTYKGGKHLQDFMEFESGETGEDL